MFNWYFITTDIADGDVRPLDEARRNALRKNGVLLLDLIDSNDAFLSELASPEVGCITWPQRDHLVNIQQPRDRNDKLLEFLRRRSVTNFNQFVKVLSTYDADLVPLLTTDGGETFLMCKSWSVSKNNAFSRQLLLTITCLHLFV